MSKDKKAAVVPAQKNTLAVRFQEKVQSELEAMSGGIELTKHQKQLVNNMYFCVDSALIAAEAKRLKNNDTSKAPYTWENVNMKQLAFDSMNRVRLGLDASLPNHIHPVAYFNTKTKQYDMNLLIGYKGKHHYRTAIAKDEPIQIRYELVYSTDTFKVLKRDSHRGTEDYIFEVTDPFDRGEIIGGFGYVVFKDPTKNYIVTVSKKDFDKVKNTGNFWKDWYENMCYKTLVHRVTSTLDPDPMKVANMFGASYTKVEQEDTEQMFGKVEPSTDVSPDAEEVGFDEVIDEETGEITETPKAKPKQKESAPKTDAKGQATIDGPGF